MEYQDFLRSKLLNTIPTRKFDLKLNEIKNSDCDNKTKSLKLLAANRFYESNIPIEYWNLNMETSFQGSKILLEAYNAYIANISDNYLSGKSILFAGTHGLGKTLTATCILKKAVLKNYSGLYTTLSEIVNLLISAPHEDKTLIFRELKMVDFLIIDEFDNRFIQSDKAADLYAQTLEGIFRSRIQNKLPTLMCTNSPNIVEAFHGPLKESLLSLTSGYLETVAVTGKDFRKI